MKKKSPSQSAPARRSLGESGFVNLRVLVGLFMGLAGVFLALAVFVLLIKRIRTIFTGNTSTWKFTEAQTEEPTQTTFRANITTRTGTNGNARQCLIGFPTHAMVTQIL